MIKDFVRVHDAGGVSIHSVAVIAVEPMGDDASRIHLSNGGFYDVEGSQAEVADWWKSHENGKLNDGGGLANNADADNNFYPIMREVSNGGKLG